MVGKMLANTARTFVNKRVNVHLNDGSVIINVSVTAVRQNKPWKNHLLVILRNGQVQEIPLRNVKLLDTVVDWSWLLEE